jgi:hypothetical protein
MSKTPRSVLRTCRAVQRAGRATDLAGIEPITKPIEGTMSIG